VCKAQPSLCNTGVSVGDAAFCPFVNPFTKSVCLGGCCKSLGKCKAPFCSLAGLGADVMTLDFICLGQNSGLFGGLNKCKNLGCKLEVPGCVSDLLGGSCLGKVTAMSKDIDADAAKYIGMPCLETTKKVLPIDKLQILTGKSEYVKGLWTVCDCNAESNPKIPTLPSLDLNIDLGGKACKGPLCALIPKLPEFNMTLPDLQLPFTLLNNLTTLLQPSKDSVALPPITDIFTITKPNITLPKLEIPQLQLPTLPKFPDADDLKTIGDAVGALVGAVGDAAQQAANSKNQALQQLVAAIPSLFTPFQLPKLELPKIEITKG
jgi:hypothetical protein